jgi:hypothetical protein
VPLVRRRFLTTDHICLWVFNAGSLLKFAFSRYSCVDDQFLGGHQVTAFGSVSRSFSALTPKGFFRHLLGVKMALMLGIYITANYRFLLFCCAVIQQVYPQNPSLLTIVRQQIIIKCQLLNEASRVLRLDIMLVSFPTQCSNPIG